MKKNKLEHFLFTCGRKFFLPIFLTLLISANINPEVAFSLVGQSVRCGGSTANSSCCSSASDSSCHCSSSNTASCSTAVENQTSCCQTESVTINQSQETMQGVCLCGKHKDSAVADRSLFLIQPPFPALKTACYNKQDDFFAKEEMALIGIFAEKPSKVPIALYY